MHYETIAALLFQVYLVLLWTGVSHLKGSTLLNAFLAPLYRLITKEALALPKKPTLSDLNVELLLACMCQSYGPVRYSILDRKKAIKVLIVMNTLSRLFKDLKYFGTIEVDEVLAYYLLLSELSHFKKKYPDELELMLMKWPLPKGNLTLSLLISNGRIRESTLESLARYLPHISDKSARLAAVNYCLDCCASGSMGPAWMDWSDNYRHVIYGAFEVRVVFKSKQTFTGCGCSSAFITSSLLHFTPSELNGALVNGLNEALETVAASSDAFFWFCYDFARCPMILRDPDSMRAIFERNVQEFQAVSFTAEQRIILSVLNKIKFGASDDIKDMDEAERKELFGMFRDNGNSALVFHIWAREDVSANVWVQFAKDSFCPGMLSRLAFGLEGFFQDHFHRRLLSSQYFTSFLIQFNYYPKSSKTRHFSALLLAKLQESSETMLALLQNSFLFQHLVTLFLDREDKVELNALIDLVSREINKVPTRLDQMLYFQDIVHAWQRIGGGVDGPLPQLAKRVGAAAVLRALNFSLLRANDVGEMLRTLGISSEQMKAALSSISHETAPRDELAAVLWRFNHCDPYWSSYGLRRDQSLWFYVLKEHPAAFFEHVHPNVKRQCRFDEPSPEVFHAAVP